MLILLKKFFMSFSCLKQSCLQDCMYPFTNSAQQYSVLFCVSVCPLSVNVNIYLVAGNKVARGYKFSRRQNFTGSYMFYRCIIISFLVNRTECDETADCTLRLRTKMWHE